MFGARCSATARQVSDLAGFTHSTQRNRHLDQLVTARHIRMRTRPWGQRVGEFDLLTNGAVNVALRDIELRHVSSPFVGVIPIPDRRGSPIGSTSTHRPDHSKTRDLMSAREHLEASPYPISPNRAPGSRRVA